MDENESQKDPKLEEESNKNNINNSTSNQIIDPHDDIINNNIRDTNNDVINNNGNNNNYSENLPEIENEEKKIEYKLTFSFKLFLLLNTLAYLHTKSPSFALKNYTLCLYPIINKNQYYRLITCHFYHSNFFDYLTNMIGFIFATKYLEQEIGSAYTFIITIHGLFYTSILYLVEIWIFIFIFRAQEYYFMQQNGFNGTIFCLYLSYFLLKKNSENNINFAFLDIKGIYLIYLIILLFQLISPSYSFLFNICGTVSSFLMFGIIKFISFPLNYWVNDFEKIIGLDIKRNSFIKNFLGYYSINDNVIIKNSITQFDSFFKFKKPPYT